MFGLALKLTHTGLSKASLHLSDVVDGVDFLASFRKAGPIYVPYLQTVFVAYTGSVAIAFETGSIRGFIDRGLLVAEFAFGPTFIATLPGGPPSGPAGGDLAGTYPNPQVNDLTIAGEQQGSVLYYNGSNWVHLPPGVNGQVLTTQGAGNNPIWSSSAGDVTSALNIADNVLVRGDGGLKGVQGSGVVLNDADSLLFPSGGLIQVNQIGSLGTGILVEGLRHYGKLASNPVGPPAPSDGDQYYNTTLNMQMVYDATRSKWLSVESSTFEFGRDGNTNAGQYYRAVDGRVMSPTLGWFAERSGTIVSLTYTRTDIDLAVFDVMASGVPLIGVSSSALSGFNASLNADFVAGSILSVMNRIGSNATSNVIGKIKVRWR
jgi:hypothetical protein